MHEMGPDSPDVHDFWTGLCIVYEDGESSAQVVCVFLLVNPHTDDHVDDADDDDEDDDDDDDDDDGDGDGDGDGGDGTM